jgi:hypothetical protein
MGLSDGNAALSDAARFIAATPIGTRVVVRSRIDGGYTDALGYLRSCDSTECVVETKRGMTVVSLGDIVLAKVVPPPPAPRPARPGH